MLCAPRGLAGTRQGSLIDDNVQRTGLSGIGTTGKGDLHPDIRRYPPDIRAAELKGGALIMIFNHADVTRPG